ncbi:MULTISPECIES: signal peptidase II [Streptomyces]|uniref:signal peptidase II n=1 Tax=Streptomyces TaxID=1883 RepID=UPI0021B1E560|nr:MULTISPECIES: signal peptidase II [Streptomyces]MCT7350711.1 signal peptidase II [Streptomyces sp. 15-116A]MCX4624500.1 signal peptidase II [Streptomyces viridodiastaticus]
MAQSTTTVRRPATRRRVTFLVTAAALAGFDLSAKAWAQSNLAGNPLEGGLLDLRLAYNPGVAFSFAAEAPAWVVIAVTAAITLAVAVYGWRTAATSGRALTLAIGAILGGATANLIDRAGDKVVTDYLHTGWWPTFNLADVFIVCGGIAVVVLSWRHPGQDRDAAPAAAD